MKTTMKILPLMLGIMLFFTQCEKDNTIQETILKDYSVFNCNGEQELWAGAGQNILANGFLVGNVEWGIDGTTLYVRYVIDKEGWSLTETHLWVGDDIADIPSNAPPGQFPRKRNHNFVSHYEYEIDISGFTSGEPLYLAAHAVVAGEEADYGALVLPVDVDFTWKLFYHQPPSLASYFDITILPGSWLASDDIYEAWCADSYVRVGDNPRSGTAYSSYDAAFLDESSAPYAFDFPENLPQVNWVLNHGFVGETSTAGGDFTLGDVQRAIWHILWDDVNPSPWGGVGQTSDERVAEIVEMAAAFADYIPGCGEDLVLIIVQDSENNQPVLIQIPVPCKGIDETAWALGGVEGTHDDYTFIENGISEKWGWFFDITCY